MPHPTILLVIGRMSLSVQHGVGSAVMVKAYVAYHWTWAEYIQNAPTQTPEGSVTADVLLRQEPDEDDEEEDQGDGKDDDNDDDQGDEDDEGYSEVSVPRSSEQLAFSSAKSAVHMR